MSLAIPDKLDFEIDDKVVAISNTPAPTLKTASKERKYSFWWWLFRIYSTFSTISRLFQYFILMIFYYLHVYELDPIKLRKRAKKEISFTILRLNDLIAHGILFLFSFYCFV